MENTTLHTKVGMRRTWFNRIFTLIYTCTIFTLLYHRLENLFISTSITSLLIFVADVVLAFMYINHQAFRLNPVRREVFPDKLAQIVLKDKREYPALDLFICTADPYKEPPMGLVNTALSVMAFDYPPEKLSIYVSDDGCSQLTLFAILEAAKFAAHWLPYCKENGIIERCPEVYFKSHLNSSPEGNKIKVMYESMKIRVENVVDRGSVHGDCITDESEVQAFLKWKDGFTSKDHPSIIQVILESGMKKDVMGNALPNLIYVSREKRTGTPHNFKAGALNVLLRVSATMTNASIILTVDCDMYSNDPKTPLRALCYHLDPCVDSSQVAFVQFPQKFYGIDKDDIYGAEYKNWTVIDAAGLDGLLGPNYMGTGSFFKRRAFFGGPNLLIIPDIPELSPHYVANKPIHDGDVSDLAHNVAGCNFEVQTKWGSEMGFRYGSLVEDYYTGYRLHCSGWKSVFCNPKRAAFLGTSPITLHDVLIQTKRWSVGLLDMALCKYSPLTFGIRSINILHALCYSHYSFWPIWSIPITIYAFLPQIALINALPIFPKVSNSMFLLYAFSFIGAYAQDMFEFILAEGTTARWWNHQRMWMVRGISSFPFALLEYLLGRVGLSTSGFDVTSKVVDKEQNKRYDQGIFEFGVPSPMFFPVTVAALINLFALFIGIRRILLLTDGSSSFQGLFVQTFIAGFVVVNSWPIYEAILFRTDKGKMPMKVTLASLAISWLLVRTISLAF